MRLTHEKIVILSNDSVPQIGAFTAYLRKCRREVDVRPIHDSTVIAPPDVDLLIVAFAGPDDRTRLLGMKMCMRAPNELIGFDAMIRDPVETSLQRIVAAIDAPLVSVAVWEHRPPRTARFCEGPLDAFANRGTRLLELELGGARVPVSHQLFVAPHTRSRLVGCALRFAEELDPGALQRLEAPNVMVALEGRGFDSTAAVAEYFRMLGNGLGYFVETVVFDSTVRARADELFLTFACTELAAVPDMLAAASRAGGAKGADER
jgi:hypothetical protein